MSLPFFNGFDTCAADSDLRAQGWVNGPTVRPAAFVPSLSSFSGKALALVGASAVGNATAPGAAGAKDVGYKATGFTVRQAWDAGGATLGMAARFNSGQSASYASGQAGSNFGVAHDGTRYWALRNIAGAFAICTSTDLANWTATPTQPSGAVLNITTTISHMGSGLIAVIPTKAALQLVVYYTSDQGTTWNTMNLGGTGASTYTVAVGCATGNATYPHAFVAISYINGSTASWYATYVGTVGGTTFGPVNGTANATAASVGKPRILGNILFLLGQHFNQRIFCANVTGGSFNVGAGWVNGVSTNVGGLLDIAYVASSNLYVVVNSIGIWTIPNSNGSSGTPANLPASFTATQRYSTVGMNNVWWNSAASLLVATGASGHIVTSPDGITWTELGPKILPVGISGTDWRVSIYDGSKYALFSDSGSGIVAVSPDLLTGYECKYATEYGESTSGAQSSLGFVGVSGGTLASTFTIAGGVGVVAGAINGTDRPINVYSYASPASGMFVSPFNVSTVTPTSFYPNPLTHYYEVQLVKDPATVNNFFVALYVDGSLLGQTAASTPIGTGTSDTTTTLAIQVPRSNQWTVFDDMYCTLDDGTGTVGPVGPSYMVVRRPTSDTTAQWTKDGAEASNAAAVSALALSSTNGYVQTTTDGAKDVYASTDTLPASGYRVKGVAVEGYFARMSAGSPVVTIGATISGVEVDSANITVSSAAYTFAQKILEKNPNGNVNWTTTTAAQVSSVINKLS